MGARKVGKTPGPHIAVGQNGHVQRFDGAILSYLFDAVDLVKFTIVSSRKEILLEVDPTGLGHHVVIFESLGCGDVVVAIGLGQTCLVANTQEVVLCFCGVELAVVHGSGEGIHANVLRETETKKEEKPKRKIDC